MPKPLNVLISYAHKDGAKLASQLQADLTARGYDTWLDRARLQGGSNWSREIEQALDNADVVLALLSAGSFESGVCRAEQLRSLRHRKSSFIFPRNTESSPDESFPVQPFWTDMVFLPSRGLKQD